MARYKAKCTFCDGVVGTVYRGNICEIPDRLAVRFVELGYIVPYMNKPDVVKPAPIADFSERIERTVKIEKPDPISDFEQRIKKVIEPAEKKPKRKYTRRKSSKRK